MPTTKLSRQKELDSSSRMNQDRGTNNTWINSELWPLEAKGPVCSITGIRAHPEAGKQVTCKRGGVAVGVHTRTSVDEAAKSQPI